MNLTINKKNYKVKYNLAARLRIAAAGIDEGDLIQAAKSGDRISIFKFVWFCITRQRAELAFEEFLLAYPNGKLVDLAIIRLFTLLIQESSDPFELNTAKEEHRSSKEPEKKDKSSNSARLRYLLTVIMSKGYTQKQALDMTYWDINLIIEADEMKLERETFHTNSIINYIARAAGYKGPSIDLLNRKAAIKEHEMDYYSGISAALKRAKENKK